MNSRKGKLLITNLLMSICHTSDSKSSLVNEDLECDLSRLDDGLERIGLAVGQLIAEYDRGRLV